MKILARTPRSAFENTETYDVTVMVVYLVNLVLWTYDHLFGSKLYEVLSL